MSTTTNLHSFTVKLDKSLDWMNLMIKCCVNASFFSSYWQRFVLAAVQLFALDESLRGETAGGVVRGLPALAGQGGEADRGGGGSLPRADHFSALV